MLLSRSVLSETHYCQCACQAKRLTLTWELSSPFCYSAILATQNLEGEPSKCMWIPFC